MKLKKIVSLGVLLGLGLPVQAQFVVNDTWIDGTRSDPSVPNGYSENGVDGDADGNIESSWYGTGGTLSVVNGSPNVTPGILRGAVGAGSSSWATYLTPDASPVTLASAGSALRITWIYTPTGVNANAGSGQSFRLAVVDTPNAARLAADGNPGNATYTGYAMFMNMSTTLDNANPFELRTRADALTSSALLSAGGSWSVLDDEETTGTGYTSGVEYTFVMTLTRNASDGLDIEASMSGGTLGGDGELNVSFTDATPDSFDFDTFTLRPSGSTQAASQFDTRVFTAELIPEPSTMALAGLAALGLVWSYRRARK